MFIFKKQLVLLILLWGFVNQSFGQETGQISGNVKDKQGSIPGVSIALWSITDSLLVKTGLSDADGNFKLNGVPVGKYTLTYNHIAYQVFKSIISITKEQPLYQAGTIYLEPIANQLSGIEIKGQVKKQMIERTIEGLTFNVNQSILAAGENGFSLLRSMPGVFIDGSENLLINGRSGVAIYVDGKPLYLSADLAKIYLKSIASSNIESIQLITNPSARYDAQGSAAIIDVKLKKHKALGFNGDVSGSLSRSRYMGYDGALNLNYKLRNVNVFATYNYNYYPYFQDGTEERVVMAANPATFKTKSLYKELIGTHFIKTGFDWDISRNHLLTLSIYGNTVNWDMPMHSTLRAESQNGMLDSTIRSNNRGTESLKNINGNINYKWNLDSTGKTLQVNLDRSYYVDNQDQHYLNQFEYPAAQKDDFAFNTENKVKINISAVKADLVLPLKQSFNLELGAKSSFTSTNNNFLFLNRINGIFVGNPNRNDRFIYKENINSGYASLRKSWDKWTAQAGLRIENTNTKGNSVLQQNEVKRNYWDFFPSVFLQRKFASGNQLNLSYSKRISRPDFRSLNPFQEFLDLYNLKEGNPYLLPEKVDAYEVAYNIKSTYFFALKYSNTSRAIRRIPFQDSETGVLLQTLRNIDSDENYSLSVSFPVRFSKKIRMDNNLNGYYQKVRGSFPGGNLNADRFTFNVYSTLDFSLPEDYGLQLSGYYISPFLNGAVYNYSQTNISAGLRKSFFGGKLSTSLRYSDIFNTNKLRGSVTFQNQRRHFENIVPTQNISLSIAYNFARGLRFSRRDIQSGAEDERNRTGKP